MTAKHARMGKLLRDGRYGVGMTANEAASILGFSSDAHLFKVERGAIAVNPGRLRRICELYRIEPEEAVSAAVRDFRETLRRAMA